MYFVEKEAFFNTVVGSIFLVRCGVAADVAAVVPVDVRSTLPSWQAVVNQRNRKLFNRQIAGKRLLLLTAVVNQKRLVIHNCSNRIVQMLHYSYPS